MTQVKKLLLEKKRVTQRKLLKRSSRKTRDFLYTRASYNNTHFQSAKRIFLPLPKQKLLFLFLSLLKALSSFSAWLSFLFVNRTRREREIFQKATRDDDDDFDDGDDALDEEVLFVEIIITIGTPLNNRAEENE